MRRHSAMEFVAGRDGVPRRRRRRARPRRRHRLVRPRAVVVGRAARRRRRLAEALVCAAARETFEESGVLFAGAGRRPRRLVDDASVYREQRAALADNALSFGDFLRSENLVLRADLLRPWANWVTPKEERTRRYDTYFFVGACPTASAPTATTPNRPGVLDDPAGRPRRVRARAGRSCCRRPGPSWTRSTGARSPRCWPSNGRSLPIEPSLSADKGTGNWDIEFFDGGRYNAARNRRAPEGYEKTVSEFVSLARRRRQSAPCCCRGRRPTR